MVCVAIIAVVGAIVVTVIYSNHAKAGEPVAVYPERGDVNSVVAVDGIYKCDESKSRQVLLADDGGKISFNSVIVSTKWSKDSVAVKFAADDKLPFDSGFIVGVEATEPFNITKDARKTRQLNFSTKDFSEAGSFHEIVLCAAKK